MSTFKAQVHSTVDAAAKAGEFYAVNTSDFNKKQAKGQLVIGIKAKDGSPIRVLFPPTWIPLDLSEYAPADDLVAAASLREYVRKGLITLVTKESYDALINHASYQTEAKRVAKITNGFTEKLNNQVEIALSASSSPMVDANANVEMIDTPITAALLGADSDETVIREYNKNLLGLGLPEIRTLSTKSQTGSLVQAIALELESLLTSGQIGTLQGDVANTQAYKDFQQRGGSGPSLEF